MITVRKTDPEQLEMLVALRERVMREVCALPEDYIFSEEFREATHQYFQSGNQTTVIAEENGQIIGCASICFVQVMPTHQHPNGRRAHLMNVFVEATHRRRGAAKAMLELLLTDAAEHGVTEITLDATQMGRPLYEALGFQPSDSHLAMTLR